MKIRWLPFWGWWSASVVLAQALALFWVWLLPDVLAMLAIVVSGFLCGYHGTGRAIDAATGDKSWRP